MADLARFLLDRIAEDEAWANAAQGLEWHWETVSDDRVLTPDPFTQEYLDEDDRVSLRGPAGSKGSEMFPDLPTIHFSSSEEVLSGSAGHIQRWNPARVLAECEAKRQIVEHGRSMFQMAEDAPHLVSLQGSAAAFQVVLARLALPYADHPDYREEWKP